MGQAYARQPHSICRTTTATFSYNLPLFSRCCFSATDLIPSPDSRCETCDRAYFAIYCNIAYVSFLCRHYTSVSLSTLPFYNNIMFLNLMLLHLPYSIVFIHFYSASHSMSLSEALPTTAIDTVSEFTRRSATGYCK